MKARLFYVAVFLFTGLAVRAEEEQLHAGAAGRWVGTRVGTWIQFEEEKARGGQTLVTKSKRTLVKIDEDACEFSVQSPENPESEPRTLTLPVDSFKVTWTDVGKETIEVDGQKFECVIKERKHEKSKGASRKWIAKIGVREVELKWSVHAEFADDSVLDDEGTAVALGGKIVVGSTTLECRVFQCTEKRRTGDAEKVTTRKIWFSPEVGGGVVRTEKTTVDADETTTSTWKVVAFGAPKEE